MSSKPEPMIWSCDTGQRIPCFHSCQLTITWMSNIQDVPMVMVLLSYFSRYWVWDVDIRTVVQQPIFQIDGLPNSSARSSSAINIACLISIH